MRSVSLCGSTRYKPEIRTFAKELIRFGVVVYEPYLHTVTPEEWAQVSSEHQKLVVAGLTYSHFHKIDMAEVVYIYNKEGYVGVSVTMEIAYAVAKNKPVYALSDKDHELARKALISGVVHTPKELLKFL